MAANSLMRRAIICCKQGLPFSFPKFLSPQSTNRRHPYLSVRYASTQSEKGDTSKLRSRLNVVNILEERGLVESLTSESLRSACSDPSLPPLRVCCVFDATAEGLHLGNLLDIIVLSWFLRCGHNVFALLYSVGGGVDVIGNIDPSDKAQERMWLDIHALDRDIESPISQIESTISQILGRNHGVDSFTILDSSQWWDPYAEGNLWDLFESVGRFVSMGEMLSKESVRKRLESEQGMSCGEFMYELLRVYKFVYLFKYVAVNVQIGGSDQRDNITLETDLISRIFKAEGADAFPYCTRPQRIRAYGLTFPALLKSDGTEFGKSEDGPIWLSCSQFYQHLFSVPDSDVSRFLKMLTFLSMEEIAQIETEMQMPGYVPKTAQRRLAEEVTLFVHGKEALDEARKATEP